MQTETTSKAASKISERSAFLSDIIITAAEGGVNYWAAVTKYDHGYNKSDKLGDCGLEPERSRTASMCVQDAEDDSEPPMLVTVKTLRKAFALVMSSKDIAHVGGDWRKRMVAEYWGKDAGELDADDADSLVQIGLFGEVRYV